MYYLDGSAFNPEIVALRRAGLGFAVLEPTELSTQAVFPVATPCLDASGDDAMEEDCLDDQMQESLGIDHAEAVRLHFLVVTQSLMQNTFLSFATVRSMLHDSGMMTALSLMLRVRLSTPVVDSCEEGKAVLLRGSTLVRRRLETSLFNVRQEIRFSVAGAEGGGSPVAG